MWRRTLMRTVQMTLDDELVEAVDAASRRLGTSRSAFTREALREALRRERIRALEERHREGYRAHPVAPGEFDGWDEEQEWGEK